MANWDRCQSDEERKARRRAVLARYKAAHPDRLKASQDKYHAANPGKRKEIRNRWTAKNPDAKRIREQNRRSRKRAAGGRLSRFIVEDLMQKQRGRCAACTTDLDWSGSELDHIMPIAKGGANSDENVQLLCPACNRRKADQLPHQWRRVLVPLRQRSVVT